jgi:hypothetical protein
MKRVRYRLQETPYGSSRLWVNVPPAVWDSIGFGKQRYLLDMLSCWGSHDTTPIKCKDETTTYSWEFPKAVAEEQLPKILSRFQFVLFSGHHQTPWELTEVPTA